MRSITLCCLWALAAAREWIAWGSSSGPDLFWSATPCETVILKPKERPVDPSAFPVLALVVHHGTNEIFWLQGAALWRAKFDRSNARQVYSFDEPLLTSGARLAIGIDANGIATLFLADARSGSVFASELADGPARSWSGLGPWIRMLDVGRNVWSRPPSKVPVIYIYAGWMYWADFEYLQTAQLKDVFIEGSMVKSKKVALTQGNQGTGPIIAVIANQEHVFWLRRAGGTAARVEFVTHSQLSSGFAPTNPGVLYEFPSGHSPFAMTVPVDKPDLVHWAVWSAQGQPRIESFDFVSRELKGTVSLSDLNTNGMGIGSVKPQIAALAVFRMPSVCTSVSCLYLKHFSYCGKMCGQVSNEECTTCSHDTRNYVLRTWDAEKSRQTACVFLFTPPEGGIRLMEEVERGKKDGLLPQNITIILQDDEKTLIPTTTSTTGSIVTTKAARNVTTTVGSCSPICCQALNNKSSLGGHVMGDGNAEGNESVSALNGSIHVSTTTLTELIITTATATSTFHNGSGNNSFHNGSGNNSEINGFGTGIVNVTPNNATSKVGAEDKVTKVDETGGSTDPPPCIVSKENWAHGTVWRSSNASSSLSSMPPDASEAHSKQHGRDVSSSCCLSGKLCDPVYLSVGVAVTLAFLSLFFALWWRKQRSEKIRGSKPRTVDASVVQVGKKDSLKEGEMTRIERLRHRSLSPSNNESKHKIKQTRQGNKIASDEEVGDRCYAGSPKLSRFIAQLSVFRPFWKMEAQPVGESSEHWSNNEDTDDPSNVVEDDSVTLREGYAAARRHSCPDLSRRPTMVPPSPFATSAVVGKPFAGDESISAGLAMPKELPPLVLPRPPDLPAPPLSMVEALTAESTKDNLDAGRESTKSSAAIATLLSAVQEAFGLDTIAERLQVLDKVHALVSSVGFDLPENILEEVNEWLNRQEILLRSQRRTAAAMEEAEALRGELNAEYGWRIATNMQDLEDAAHIAGETTAAASEENKKMPILLDQQASLSKSTRETEKFESLVEEAARCVASFDQMERQRRLQFQYRQPHAANDVVGLEDLETFVSERRELESLETEHIQRLEEIASNLWQLHGGDDDAVESTRGVDASTSSSIETKSKRNFDCSVSQAERQKLLDEASRCAQVFGEDVEQQSLRLMDRRQRGQMKQGQKPAPELETLEDFVDQRAALQRAIAAHTDSVQNHTKALARKLDVCVSEEERQALLLEATRRIEVFEEEEAQQRLLLRKARPRRPKVKGSLEELVEEKCAVAEVTEKYEISLKEHAQAIKENFEEDNQCIGQMKRAQFQVELQELLGVAKRIPDLRFCSQEKLQLAEHLCGDVRGRIELLCKSYEELQRGGNICSKPQNGSRSTYTATPAADKSFVGPELLETEKALARIGTVLQDTQRCLSVGEDDDEEAMRRNLLEKAQEQLRTIDDAQGMETQMQRKRQLERLRKRRVRGEKEVERRQQAEEEKLHAAFNGVDTRARLVSEWEDQLLQELVQRCVGKLGNAGTSEVAAVVEQWWKQVQEVFVVPEPAQLPGTGAQGIVGSLSEADAVGWQRAQRQLRELADAAVESLASNAATTLSDCTTCRSAIHESWMSRCAMAREKDKQTRLLQRRALQAKALARRRRRTADSAQPRPSSGHSSASGARPVSATRIRRRTTVDLPPTSLSEIRNARNSINATQERVLTQCDEELEKQHRARERRLQQRKDRLQQAVSESPKSSSVSNSMSQQFPVI